MNVGPPESLIAIRRPSALGSMFGRAFRLTTKLPEDLAAYLARLPGRPGSADEDAEAADTRTEG